MLCKSTFLLGGSVDALTSELAMLDAVLMAEARDHANWSLISQVSELAGPGPGQDSLHRAAQEVEPQEEEDVGWAQWARGVLALVAAQGAGKLAADRMEEVMARALAILTSGSMNAAQ